MKRRFRKIFVVMAALGFLLLLTELDDGPWAGTYLGAALLILGALAALNAKKITAIMPNKKGGTKNEIHLRVYRRPSGRDDAA